MVVLPALDSFNGVVAQRDHSQPEARYALYYDQIQAISRRDGLIVQMLGANDEFGYGIADETPDRTEAERALATLNALYE